MSDGYVNWFCFEKKIDDRENNDRHLNEYLEYRLRQMRENFISNNLME